MRKLVFLSLLMLMITGFLSAQTDDFAEATVSVVVLSSMNVEALRDLDLGTVVQGSSVSVASNEFNTAAQFRVDASSGIDISVTLTPPGELSYNGSTLTFDALDPWSGEASDGSDAAELTGWIGGGGGTLQTTNGVVYLWVGGGVTVPAAQDEGNYTGTYRVDAEYIGI